MDAWFARNRLSAYLDGSLPPDEVAELERALDGDPALRDEFESMKATIALVREHGRLRAPEGFHDRVMARLATERPPAANVARYPASRWRWVALAVAATVLFAIPSTMWWHLGRAPRVEMSVAAGPQPDAAEEPEEAPAAMAARPAPRSVAEEAKLAARELRDQRPEGLRDEGSTASRVASGGHSRVTGLPTEGTYVPSWDQDPAARELLGQAEDGAVLAGGVHRRPSADWRITLGSSDVLFRLKEISDHAGGELLDGSNRPLDLRELTIEQNWARAQIVVPATRRAEVSAALTALGALEGRPLGEVADTETVVFRVDVQYEP